MKWIQYLTDIVLLIIITYCLYSFITTYDSLVMWKSISFMVISLVILYKRY